MPGRDYPRDWNQFFDWFADEEACLSYLEQLRWPEGFVCPQCGEASEPYRASRGRLVCRGCRYQSTVTGDIANTGTPKAGVFAEGAAMAVATSVVSRIRGEGEGSLYAGAGTCYIEFGAGRVGRVDVDFFSGPKPTGTYHEPSVALRGDKERFAASRRARWFGL